MAPFEEIAETLAEPAKTMVLIFAQKFNQEYFSNHVVLGNYPNNEPAVINAWSMVGLVPGVKGFLECHTTSGGTEAEKFRWLAKLRQVIPILAVYPGINLDHSLLGGMMHAKLGIKKAHVIGMISLHQAIESREDFAVLWRHPELSRESVEYVMKPVLEERL